MIQVGFLLPLCIAALTAGASAYTPCVTTIKPVENFDAKNLEGTWAEVRQIFSTPGREGSCGSATYKAKPDGSLDVTLNWLDKAGKPKTVSGTIIPVGAKTLGRLTVKIGGTAVEYQIFDMNKDRFAAHACIGGFSDVWIFAKAQKIEEKSLDSIKLAMTKAGLDPMTLEVTVRKNCVYT